MRKIERTMRQIYRNLGIEVQVTYPRRWCIDQKLCKNGRILPKRGRERQVVLIYPRGPVDCTPRLEARRRAITKTWSF